MRPSFAFVVLFGACTATIPLPSATTGVLNPTPTPKLTIFEHSDICPIRCGPPDVHGRHVCDTDARKFCADDTFVVRQMELTGLIEEYQHCEAQLRRSQAKVEMRDAEKRWIRQGKNECKAAMRRLELASGPLTVTVTVFETISAQRSLETPTS